MCSFVDWVFCIIFIPHIPTNLQYHKQAAKSNYVAQALQMSQRAYVRMHVHVFTQVLLFLIIYFFHTSRLCLLINYVPYRQHHSQSNRVSEAFQMPQRQTSISL